MIAPDDKMATRIASLLTMAPLISDNEDQQVAALVGAALVILERTHGPALAAPMILDLIEPTLNGWIARAEMRRGAND